MVLDFVAFPAEIENAMDAPEDDRDVLLQRSSADLLGDLESSLKPFLWKTAVSGKTRIRRAVRIRETNRLVDLVPATPQMHWENPHNLALLLTSVLARALPRAAPASRSTPRQNNTYPI